MTNLIVFVIVAVIVGGAGTYIYKEKKKGVKCIGCPAGKKCGACCEGCASRGDCQNP